MMELRRCAKVERGLPSPFAQDMVARELVVEYQTRGSRRSTARGALAPTKCREKKTHRERIGGVAVPANLMTDSIYTHDLSLEQSERVPSTRSSQASNRWRKAILRRIFLGGANTSFLH